MGRKAGRAGHILRKWIEFFLILMQWQQNDWQTKKTACTIFWKTFDNFYLGSGTCFEANWTAMTVAKIHGHTHLWSGIILGDVKESTKAQEDM